MPISRNNLYLGKGVLGANAGAPLSVDATGLLDDVLANTEVSAIADATTTSGTDVLMTGMTITPVAGTYLTWFSCTVEHSNQVTAVTISIYSGGTQKADSVRPTKPVVNALGAQSLSHALATNGVVTVNGSQAIEIRWNRGGAGTGTVHQRTMNILRVA